MVNRTPLARRAQIIGALVEGNSIRSTERMTNTHRDTIMRLMVEVGAGCLRIMDEKMRDLPCKRLQCDEIWAYVRKKQMHLRPGESVRAGDFWTFVAIDADTKLVPSYLVGKRTRANAEAFMQDLSERLTNRVQLSTDSLPAYENAVEQAFGGDADYGQIVKFFDAEPIGPGRYSPPRVTGAERTVISGFPEMRHISGLMAQAVEDF
jgi:IS1 family transposase